jgi:hypothetical protein
MNKYLYIPPGSFHVKSIFKAFITNEIKRYRISCTSDEDFLDIKTKFYSRLIAREYVPTQIDPLFSIEYTREDLLVDKLPSYTHKSISIPFKINNTLRFKHSDIISILKIPEDIIEHPHFYLLFQGRQPIIIYKRPKNLKEILINNKTK